MGGGNQPTLRAAPLSKLRKLTLPAAAAAPLTLRRPPVWDRVHQLRVEPADRIYLSTAVRFRLEPAFYGEVPVCLRLHLRPAPDSSRLRVTDYFGVTVRFRKCATVPGSSHSATRPRASAPDLTSLTIRLGCSLPWT
jgi:hypothetical protein